MGKTTYRFEKGDCLDLLKALPDNSIETCITDPPYGITFMGRAWDRGLPSEAVWGEILRVVKPGGILLSFGGSRTFHRLACHIEDAGWEIRDCIMWMYGTGFPKSMNIAKAMDKAKRGFPQGGPDPASPNAGKFKSGCTADSPLGRHHGAGPGGFMKEQGVKDERELCEEARQWDGWGTALKPSYEPIICAMKPLEGTFVENAEKWGVAGVNIDSCRISTTDNLDGGAYAKEGKERYDGYEKWRFKRKGDAREFQQPSGRWPANILLSHHPDCVYLGTKTVKSSSKATAGGRRNESGVYGKYEGYKDPIEVGYADKDGKEKIDEWDCHEDCPVKLLDEQTGVLTSGTGAMKKSTSEGWQGNAYGKESRPHGTPNVEYGDSGGASRFFYCSKASRKERNEGCEHLLWEKGKNDYALVDKDKWDSLPKSQQARGNIHTTVKPLEILRYLCKLTSTPEGGTVLDPFAGSGSTGVAAIKTGRDFIGFDNDLTACVIAEARLSHTKDKYAA